MSGHVNELLPEFSLGTLDESASAAVEEHLQICEPCAGELSVLYDGLAELAFDLQPVDPSTELRGRLVDAVAATNRFDDLADRIAEMYDVSAERALELLARIDNPERWKPGIIPGTKMIPFRPGEKFSDHIAGFMRVPPGSAFPWHEHVGDELTLVLQGSCRDTDGTVYRRGDQGTYEPGTAHDFTTPDDGPDFVFAARLGVGALRIVPRPDDS